MLNCIPEDLLHKVLDYLPLRDMARLLCVSPQFREAVLHALRTLKIKLDPQDPDQVTTMVCWLRGLSACPETFPCLQILQLCPLAPAAESLREPALVFTGEHPSCSQDDVLECR